MCMLKIESFSSSSLMIWLLKVNLSLLKSKILISPILSPIIKKLDYETALAVG